MSPTPSIDASVHPSLESAEAHYERNNLVEAERICRLLLQEQPDQARVLHLLGRIAHHAGNPGVAAAFLGRAVAIDPSQAIFHDRLGKALLQHGRPGDASECFRRAAALDPGFVRAYVNLGAALRETGDTDAAIASFRRAIAIQPELVTGYINLAIALMDRFQLKEAEASLRRALEIDPDDVNAMVNLGGALMNQGRLEESVALLRKAIDVAPDMPEGHSNLLFALHYPAEVTRDSLRHEARTWALRHAAPFASEIRPHDNMPDPDRRLRIGYVSADFHRHPVGYFLQSVLRAHDKSQVEVFCYSNHRGVDELTQRLRPCVDEWRTVVGVSDTILAEVVRRDAIDILVDLSGHTGGHRLSMFARKPAPVQVTWAGYFDTTGLDTIDYILVDRFVCPAGDEWLYSERVLRLPDDYLCYTPQSDQPVAPLPAAERGYITFGCFNKVAKLTPHVVALWSRILHELPDAHLCLKDTALDDLGVRERCMRCFAAHAIPAQRLRLLGRTPYQEYLKAYSQIDITLDPFPFNGGTTTVESLWMGVPVITLAGDRFAGRMGVSHLTNVGLSELVAHSPADYVDTCVHLATDLSYLSGLRAGLRERMAASPLCDGVRFTRALEALYRQIWRTWCSRN